MDIRSLFTTAIALLLGLGNAYAGNETYSTVDAAATAALNQAEGMTDKYEAGVAIYQCGRSYSFLPPVTDNNKVRVSIPVFDVDGCAVVALVHTHPKGDARFSPTDIASVCKLKTVGYIKPRGGDIRRFDCATLTAVEVKIITARQQPISGDSI